ncbi:MAG: response regulator transcription factor [Spirochaetales bacterium]|nr:response regulator transcription factor [Spirochaetales bacterium]
MKRDRILIVEDEPAIADAIFDGLQDEGFVPEKAGSGEKALTLLDSMQIDLVLLDIRLPGIDGYETCRQIRMKGFHMPVIFVSARDEVLDRVVGLEVGGDDYLVKPFSFRELFSRIKAQMRRAYGEFSAGNDQVSPENKNTIVFGAVSVNIKGMRARRDGKDLFLTPIEMRLLMLFLEYPGQVLTRDQIMNQVWSENWNPEDPKTVNVHIRHLREKIEENPAKPVYLKTVRGYGYRFDQ